ncbi:MAG: hypothetical protein ACE5K4_00550 [Candidatus Hydrothermarchaeota archaeon]
MRHYKCDWCKGPANVLHLVKKESKNLLVCIKCVEELKISMECELCKEEVTKLYPIYFEGERIIVCDNCVEKLRNLQSRG